MSQINHNRPNILLFRCKIDAKLGVTNKTEVSSRDLSLLPVFEQNVITNIWNQASLQIMQSNLKGVGMKGEDDLHNGMLTVLTIN